ncbi:prepilin peptidase [Clostridium sp. 19966]|uniref:prepilin peptidase n=1 Tax=Clostridium sp. 19966 TaxID=2768166 RepID=UPI0028F0E4DA|nr:prepilin peptidase [Clostridium sp. 19966]
MEYFIGIYVFVFGLILGSFYNVCIYRIPAGESIANPPSHCPSCGNRLKPIDLVPVFSYIFLGGKCRYCREKISPRYAFVELLTGMVFISLYMRYGLSFDFIKYIILASFLIIIGLIDYDTTDVYSVISYSGIICGILFVIIAYFLGNDVKPLVLGFLIPSIIIGIIVLTTGAMGTGDIEICALAGLFLGITNSLVMLFFSFILGAVCGVVLIATKKKSRKDYIAFGPYIAMGAFIAMIWGSKIVSFYLQ